jgi:acetylornithine deacetylase/succinyl-diaminopimelate desuccinylase-like protein
VARALARVERAEPRAVARLIELASIVSPSGREHARAAAVARMMRQIGLTNVTVDSTPNVTGTIPGRSGRAVVFVTMLDDLPIIATFQRTQRARRQGDRVIGPATEIQSTVAAMLTAAEALIAAGVRPEHDLVFAAVAREETGLQGMEALYAGWRTRAAAFVEVMGDGGEIFYGAGGAIAWWRVVARGPEGHTAEGGLPNVNQAIARAVDRIFALPHPERDRDRETAINVGMLRSGEVFNHKPATGWFSLDVRSRDREIVEAIGREIRTLLDQVGRETGITLEMVPDVLSLGGQIPGARDTLLTRAAVAASRFLGYEPTLSDLGCCNMRVAIGGGTLAISLHGGRGGDRGTATEWASIPSLLNAARQIILLSAAH